MLNFIHDQPGVRIVFGAGTFSQLPEEVQRLGGKRALLLTSSRRRREAEDAARRLGQNAAGIFAEAVMHVPAETARAGSDAAKNSRADCCIAIGGGSTIGLGKAIARNTGLPVIAVPTTYSGSEMTPIYGITEGGVKKTGRDPTVLPRTVIYDPVLTANVPGRVAGPSGMNALAHCIAAQTDEMASPIARLFAKEGRDALTDALPLVVGEPGNLIARADALYGSWLAGSVLAMVRLNIHYRICHVLGGTFGLPHAEVHGVMLPHTVAYNLSVEEAQALFDLAVAIGAPVALKDIGMPESGLDRAAMLATENVGYNPKPVDYGSVRGLLEEAYSGQRPA
jgi:alcohol dehydrogenase class IV